MGSPWTDAVKQGRRLSVSPPGGSWADAFAEGARQFNVLARSHALGVSLRSIDSSTGTGSPSPDVTVQAAADSVSFSYGGTTHSDRFDGNRLHGRTFQVSRAGKIEKAFVFLPQDPLINTPKGQRAVGRGVKMLIAVHELVHACGLTDADHSTDDLFQGNPQVDYGQTAAGDRVLVQARGRTRRMPPLYLSNTTARLISQLWS